jgi:hypothetical protein
VSAGLTLTRFSVTRTFTNVNTTKVTLDIRANVTNGEVVDFTLRIAAPQLEQGAFPTSYIPTTTAAATRAADSAVVTPIASFYNQSEGTLFAEASRTHTAKAVNFAAFVDGTDANKYFVIETGVAVPAQQRMQVGGGTGGALLQYANGVADTTYRMIAAHALNDFIGAQNGTLTSADASGAAPSTLTRLSIGMNSTDTNAFYGGSQVHIRKIAYWPRRLSNTLLQQLTT